MFSNNFTDFVFVHVAPAALSKTKCPLRCNVAASYQIAELFYDIFDILAGNDINIQVPVGCCDHQFFGTGISHIKTDDSRVICKDTKSFFAVYYQEVVCAVQGVTVFFVFRIVAAFAFIIPASFVDTTNIFTQTIDLIFVFHGVRQGHCLLIHGKIRQYAVFLFRFV